MLTKINPIVLFVSVVLTLVQEDTRLTSQFSTPQIKECYTQTDKRMYI